MAELTQRYDLPRVIRKGIPETLDVDVFSVADVQQTASAATVSIYAGSRLLVNEASASTLGPPMTYDLPAATTESENLSDQWLEVWTATIGGATHVFQRPAYLVLRRLDPVITDTDLVAVHSDLADLRDPDQTTYQVQRELAWTRLQKLLIQRGNRPQLITDAWQLRDVHVLMTLELIFRDFASSTGDGRYIALADGYRVDAAAEFGNLQLTYDFDQDGKTDSEDERKNPNPVVFLSPSWGYRGW